jgi:hypothetical protein
MARANGLRQLYNGVPPALIRHGATALGLLLTGTFAGTLLYAEVKATGEKADDNRASVDAIEEKINEVTMQQRVLIQRFKDEGKWNAEFRDKTGRALERILERLSPRGSPR